MSVIDDVFDQSRIDFGLKQKPNWNGTVYGVCMTKNCPNYKHIGYYEGGFCKKCSTRHYDDVKLPVLSGVVDSSGLMTQIPNPRIRWRSKIFVKDVSHMLSGSEREEFYMTPEERQKKLDRITAMREEAWDSDIGEPEKPKGRKPKQEEEWYE